MHCDDHCADTQSALANDVDGRTITCGCRQSAAWAGPGTSAWSQRTALQHATLVVPAASSPASPPNVQPTCAGGSTLELRGQEAGHSQRHLDPRFRRTLSPCGWVWVWMTVHIAYIHNPAHLQNFQIRIQTLPKIPHLLTRLTLKQPLLLGLSIGDVTRMYTRW